jgi:TPP-dependent trihydroxycyclohexane-1,2-dione (THcHDO) dehydratase
MAFRSPRRRPASRRCLDHPLNWARSASPARRPPMPAAEEADVVIASARACRISPPARGRCSRTACRSSASISQAFDAVQAQTACRWSPTRGGLIELRSARACGLDSAADGEAKLQGERRLGTGMAEPPTRRPRDQCAPSDAQVIGAVQRARERCDVVVCAAGGLPGELHKLWQAGAPGGYHGIRLLDCMGYEIAGGLGVKMAEARPRGRRDGRRRLLPDDEFRDRHLGDAGPASSPSCCSTIAAMAASTGCRWRPAAPTSTICWRHAATRRCPI